MTLMREVIAGWKRLGGEITSYSMPSTRKRTTSSRSNGSTWMSLARSLTACESSPLTSLMIGAASSDSSRSRGSWASSLATTSSRSSSRSIIRSCAVVVVA